MKSLHVTETNYYVMPVRDGDTEEAALQRFLDLDPVNRDALLQEVRERETEIKSQSEDETDHIGEAEAREIYGDAQ